MLISFFQLVCQILIWKELISEMPQFPKNSGLIQIALVTSTTIPLITSKKTDYTKSSDGQNKLEPNYEELYIHEILCGKPSSNFLGLNTMITFMEQQNYSTLHKEQIEQILEFLEARSKGEVPTGAKFIREYVLNHPLYKKDSIISPQL